MLLLRIFKSSKVELYGFYCHSGNAYSSETELAASGYLSDELKMVDEAAKRAQELLKPEDNPFWVLSVGSTPTANAASKAKVRDKLKVLLTGKLEIHAGKCSKREDCTSY